jgi:hypothetical protein
MRAIWVKTDGTVFSETAVDLCNECEVVLDIRVDHSQADKVKATTKDRG